MPSLSPAKRLRQLITRGQIVIAPGVENGLTAKLVEKAGFSVAYASGGAIARSCGYPDLGLLTLTEVLGTVEHIVDSVTIPVIADADTGFGNAINVSRTVQLFEKIGVAAVHLEDQAFPKRCGHLNDKSLISTEEMVQKIKVARDVLHNDDFVLIARTDAIAVEGFSSAMIRAKAYLAAGADVIFVEAPQTIEQIEFIAKEIKEPKLLNMFYGGKTPLVPREKLQALGYELVIIPSDLQRAAIFAIQKTLAAIKDLGDSSSMADELVSFQDREQLIDTAGYLKLLDV